MCRKQKLGVVLTVCATFVFGWLMSGSGVVLSQETPQNMGAANAAFEAKRVPYYEVLKVLNAFKQEYPTATPQRQREIDVAYNTKIDEGAQMRSWLLPLAIAAWDEAPGTNPNVANLMYNFVGFEFNRDNPEISYQLFKKLLALPIPSGAEVLYVFAALSAINCMELDDASTWLEAARQNGALERYLNSVDEKKSNTVLGLTSQLPKFRRDWEVEKGIRQRESEAAASDPAQRLPRVEIETSKGKIVVELYENEAPNTITNFISLVEKGFYDGTIFHRVLPQFMAQGGDPTGTGTGGPGYGIACECRQPNYRKHFRGVLSMAHAGPDTGGSQFFLTFTPTSFLDGKHTAFGRVVEGIEVLAEIRRVDPEDENYDRSLADKIVRARVISKRDHDYTPKTLPSRR